MTEHHTPIFLAHPNEPEAKRPRRFGNVQIIMKNRSILKRRFKRTRPAAV